MTKDIVQTGTISPQMKLTELLSASLMMHGNVNSRVLAVDPPPVPMSRGALSSAIGAVLDLLDDDDFDDEEENVLTGQPVVYGHRHQ